MWNEREAEGWKRDRKGYRGCLRLWLPKGEFIDRQQERFIDEGAQEGSSRKKKIRDSTAMLFVYMSVSWIHPSGMNSLPISPPWPCLRFWWFHCGTGGAGQAWVRMNDSPCSRNNNVKSSSENDSNNSISSAGNT